MDGSVADYLYCLLMEFVSISPVNEMWKTYLEKKLSANPHMRRTLMLYMELGFLEKKLMLSDDTLPTEQREALHRTHEQTKMDFVYELLNGGGWDDSTEERDMGRRKVRFEKFEMPDGKKIMTLSEYAKDRGTSYEAVRKMVCRHEKKLEGHIPKINGVQCLDEEAAAFLDTRRRDDKGFALEEEHKSALEGLVKSGTAPSLIVRRANILLLKGQGKTNTYIANELHVSRHTVEFWVDRYFSRASTDSVWSVLKFKAGGSGV